MTDVPEPLELWTIYYDPLDYPGQYVARRFLNDQPAPDGLLTAPSLDELRVIFAGMGLICFQRHPLDEPQIVECWL